MSAIVISLVDARRRKVKIEHLSRQVEKDLQRVLSLLRLAAEKSA
jgi:hypothetical protein